MPTVCFYESVHVKFGRNEVCALYETKLQLKSLNVVKICIATMENVSLQQALEN